jgi:DNA-binding transcriptional ArsR family regulator
MGVTRIDLYDIADVEFAAIAKALAHPARIAIIKCLLASESCITGDLSEQIGLAQPTISQHLKELKKVEIIRGTISGTSINYCIDSQKWSEISRVFADLFAKFPKSENCC